jgi:nucleotide-binding universal stress UspA family protein
MRQHRLGGLSDVADIYDGFGLHVRERPGLSEQSRLATKILTAVDGSEESMKAAKYAMGLAKVTGATVVAIYTILLPQYVADEVLRRLKEDLASKGSKALDEVSQMAKGQGVGLECRTVDTDTSVVNAICDSAEREKADLIILGTRGSGGVAKLMLGSVAGGVVKSAHCSVLIVR